MGFSRQPSELVVVRFEGRLRWNSLNSMPIKEIHDRWIGVYATQAVELLARLKRDLEDPEARQTLGMTA